MSPARLIAGLCLIVSLSFPNPALAQDVSPSPEPSTSPTVSSSTGGGEALNSSNYKAPQNADYAVMNLMHAALCQLAGMSPTGNCLANVKDAQGNTQVLSFAQVPGGGAVGGLSGMIASLYNKPTSSVQYLAEVGSNIGVVRSAHAQSVLESSGGRVIRPVLGLWQFTQRLAYIAFVIVFLAVGFMIMLRRKMNPQTVITIQSALPGLVVGLIMVTFSYFVAAAIVDISFVGVQAVAGVFAEEPNAFGGTTDRTFNAEQNRTNLQNLANSSNIFDFLGYTVRHVQEGDATDALNNAIDQINNNTGGVMTGVFAIIGTVVGILIGTIVAGGFIGGAVGAAVGAAGGAAAGGQILSLLVPIVLVIALSIQLFRLFFALIGAYIQILVSTIFGPLIILFSSVPGQGKRMTDWMKTLLANALIFPAVFAVFLFAGAMLAITDTSAWRNPPPLFGNLPTDLLRILIAYGALLAVPTIPDMVKGAFGIKGGDNFGKAAFAGAMAGYGVAQAGAPFVGRSGLNFVYPYLQQGRVGAINIPWGPQMAERIRNRFGGARWFTDRSNPPSA